MGTTVQNLEKLPRMVRAAGDIKLWYGASAPAGWAFCTGGAVSRTTYAALFSLLGTNHGTGDGSTTFNLPDFRDRVPCGSSGSRALHAKTGAADVTLALAQIPPRLIHSNYRTDTSATVTPGTVYFLAANSGTGIGGGPATAAIWYTTAPTGSATLQLAPLPQTAVPVLPKNQALNFIIFLGA